MSRYSASSSDDGIVGGHRRLHVVEHGGDSFLLHRRHEWRAAQRRSAGVGRQRAAQIADVAGRAERLVVRLAALGLVHGIDAGVERERVGLAGASPPAAPAHTARRQRGRVSAPPLGFARGAAAGAAGRRRLHLDAALRHQLAQQRRRVLVRLRRARRRRWARRAATRRAPCGPAASWRRAARRAPPGTAPRRWRRSRPPRAASVWPASLAAFTSAPRSSSSLAASSAFFSSAGRHLQVGAVLAPQTAHQGHQRGRLVARGDVRVGALVDQQHASPPGRRSWRRARTASCRRRRRCRTCSARRWRRPSSREIRRSAARRAWRPSRAAASPDPGCRSRPRPSAPGGSGSSRASACPPPCTAACGSRDRRR